MKEKQKMVKVVKKVIGLTCKKCGKSVELSSDYCPNSRFHKFQVTELWSDLPSDKVHVCWKCGKRHSDKVDSCEYTLSGEHAFIEVDLLHVTGLEMNPSDEKGEWVPFSDNVRRYILDK